MLESVVNWLGSKRTQADEIIKYIPREIDTYYEPFCGGAAILHRLLSVSDTIKVKHYVASDLNPDLISLYKLVKTKPKLVINYYTKLWKEFNVIKKDKKLKIQYYNEVRDRYNKEHNPLDFLFIMRTCNNGMPNYKSDGNFNTQCGKEHTAINPDMLYKKLLYWNHIVNLYDVEFRCCDYKTIKPEKNDFCYFDPPYANFKGLYYGLLDLEELWQYLRGLKCKWLLSFDGLSGEKDYTYNVPKDIYSEHKYINNGYSRIKLMFNKHELVYDSLYISK